MKIVSNYDSKQAASKKPNERRYYWSPLSHSVEQVIVRKGRVEHG